MFKNLKFGGHIVPSLPSRTKALAITVKKSAKADFKFSSPVQFHSQSSYFVPDILSIIVVIK